jgi:hypothetical protein
VRPPRFWLYWPRIASFRGWVLAVQALWVLFVNAVSIAVWIIHAVIWLLWVLLWYTPRYFITKGAAANSERKLNNTKARMRDYIG